MIPAPVGDEAIHEGSKGAGGAGAGSSGGGNGGGGGAAFGFDIHMIYIAMDRRALALLTRWLSDPKGLSSVGMVDKAPNWGVIDSIVPRPPGRDMVLRMVLLLVVEGRATGATGATGSTGATGATGALGTSTLAADPKPCFILI
jgi:hypothetical protein